MKNENAEIYMLSSQEINLILNSMGIKLYSSSICLKVGISKGNFMVE